MARARSRISQGSVMLVGGAPALRDRMAACLRLAGFEVTGSFGSVAEALGRVARLRPQVLAAVSRPAGPRLSPREVEVLRLLARGHAYADVARALGVRLTTVQSHVRKLYAKLEVSSKAEAAVIAVRRGLLEG